MTIIPVDSEHSAVAQCLEGRNSAEIRRFILTASGGPFVDMRKSDLKNIKAKEALKHPNWSMGRKISIDSATLMNKRLEVIEACWHRRSWKSNTAGKSTGTRGAGSDGFRPARRGRRRYVYCSPEIGAVSPRALQRQLRLK